MQNLLWNFHDRQVGYSCWKYIEAWLKANRSFIDSDVLSIQKILGSEPFAQALQIAGAVDNSVLGCQQTPQEAIDFPCFKAPVLYQLTMNN